MISTDSVEATSLVSTPTEGVLVTADSKGRLRVSREQRKAVLARFEQSGMSAAKFAVVAGIKYSTFAGWVQRYRRAKPNSALRRLRLLEAVVDPGHAPERTSEPVVMVHLPGQVRIELSSLAQVPLVTEKRGPRSGFYATEARNGSRPKCRIWRSLLVPNCEARKRTGSSNESKFNPF